MDTFLTSGVFNRITGNALQVTCITRSDYLFDVTSEVMHL